nr:MAG TPA: hypothetical protein [Bacteriophage sp.]
MTFLPSSITTRCRTPLTQNCREFYFQQIPYVRLLRTWLLDFSVDTSVRLSLFHLYPIGL